MFSLANINSLLAASCAGRAERFGVKVPRWIALIAMGLTLALSLQLWLQGGYSLTQSAEFRSGSLNSTCRGSAFWYLYSSRH